MIFFYYYLFEHHSLDVVVAVQKKYVGLRIQISTGCSLKIECQRLRIKISGRMSKKRRTIIGDRM